MRSEKKLSEEKITKTWEKLVLTCFNFIQKEARMVFNVLPGEMPIFCWSKGHCA